MKSYNIAPGDDFKRHLGFTVVDGQTSVTIKQLQKIAQYFNKGLLFFLDSNPVEENKIHSTAFRTINSQRTSLSRSVKNLIERVELQRTRYIELLEQLSIPLKNWQPPFKHLNATEIRSWLQLDKAGNFEGIRQAIEDKGIMVFQTNGYKGNWYIEKESPIRGFSLYYNNLPVVVTKKHDSKKAQTFTLMHELGHILLHRESYIDDEDNFYSSEKKEKEANEFAGSVLLPDEVVSVINPPENIQEYDSNLELQRISDQYSVSIEVILRRLLIHEKISNEAYQTYRQMKAKTGFQSPKSGGNRKRSMEPLHIFGHSFVNTVFAAYYEKHISLSKVSSYLDNLKISYVTQLEKYVQL